MKTNFQKIYITIGCPGSGKSTYYKEHYINDSSIIYISSDTIRKELLGSEDNQSNGNIVFNTLYNRVYSELISNNSIYVDACFINCKARKQIMKILKKYHNIKIIALVFNVGLGELIDRDSKRERSVGKDIIKKFFDRKIQDTVSIEEGFDDIIYI